MHVAWDYETSDTQYYHIFPVSTTVERILQSDALRLGVPETTENTQLVRTFCDILNTWCARQLCALLEG